MVDIARHPLLRAIYEAGLANEKQPASPEQTETAVRISAAMREAETLVEQWEYLDERRNQRMTKI